MLTDEQFSELKELVEIYKIGNRRIPLQASVVSDLITEILWLRSALSKEKEKAGKQP